MLALAKAPLDAVLEKVENATTMGHELGDIVGRFGTARVARAHLMMAGALPTALNGGAPHPNPYPNPTPNP